MSKAQIKKSFDRIKLDQMQAAFIRLRDAAKEAGRQFDNCKQNFIYFLCEEGSTDLELCPTWDDGCHCDTIRKEYGLYDEL